MAEVLVGTPGSVLKRVDSKAFSALAALHNRGLFAAGALLVGSNAFGAVLNKLGARMHGHFSGTFRRAPAENQDVSDGGNVPIWIALTFP